MKNFSEIWITWENQRRSVELAKAINAKLFVLTYTKFGNRLLRYFVLSIKTILIVGKYQPDIIYAQNPSIILVFVLSLLKKKFFFKLIVDRHSNFKFETIKSKNLKWKVFHYLSRFTLYNADITVVTNKYLKNVVDDWGGVGCVLADKLPVFSEIKCYKFSDSIEKKIVFVSSFDKDEPLKEIVSVGYRLPSSYRLYITGDYKKQKFAITNKKLPSSIKLTGYLSETNYQSLLANCDIVIVLTKQDYTLNCGAYEAVSLEKPMILSDTSTIRNFFSKGVIYCKNDVDSIYNSIFQVFDNYDQLKNDVSKLKKELSFKWKKQFETFVEMKSKI